MLFAWGGAKGQTFSCSFSATEPPQPILQTLQIYFESKLETELLITLQTQRNPPTLPLYLLQAVRVNWAFDNYKMIKQTEKLDAIKLYVSLIAKLKNHEEINITNKLLNTEFKKIRDKPIKTMLEVESLHYEGNSEEEINDIAKTVLIYRNLAKPGTRNQKVCSLLLLKLHSIALSQAIKHHHTHEVTKLSQELLANITSIDQYRYVVQITFHLQSVLSLQRVDIEKIEEKYSNQKELQQVLYMIALAKASVKWQEAVAILSKLKIDPQILDQQRVLIDLLGELSVKEGFLLKGIQEKALPQVDPTSMKAINKTIESSCNLMICEDNQCEIFNQINSSLDVRTSLYTQSLTHLYYEKNPEVLESIKHTQLYIHLLERSNRMKQGDFKKCPTRFKDYLIVNESDNIKIFAPLCTRGLMLIKHNYGNMQSSNKFVRCTDEHFQYCKNKHTLDSATQWSLSEVLGVVYGKVTPRQLDNKEEPELCFSIILKDRTVDLSVEHKERLPGVIGFIRGVSAIINQYNNIQASKAEEKLKNLKEGKQSKAQELAKRIHYHHGKIQNLTKGRLLWSELILSLNKRMLISQNGKRYTKMEGIKQVGKASVLQRA